MNLKIYLNFLQKITSIKEKLICLDPYLSKSEVYHEIKKLGLFLKNTHRL